MYARVRGITRGVNLRKSVFFRNFEKLHILCKMLRRGAKPILLIGDPMIRPVGSCRDPPEPDFDTGRIQST